MVWLDFKFSFKVNQNRYILLYAFLVSKIQFIRPYSNEIRLRLVVSELMHLLNSQIIYSTLFSLAGVSSIADFGYLRNGTRILKLLKAVNLTWWY